MQSAFDRKILLAAALALAGLSVLVAVDRLGASRLGTIAERLDHENEVQRTTQAIRVTLVELEASWRGDRLAHERSRPVPDRSGLGRLETELRTLKALSVDAPERSEDLARLEVAIASWRAASDEALLLADRDGVDGARGRIMGASGPAAMAEARAALSRLGVGEARAWAAHRADQVALLDRHRVVSTLLVATIPAMLVAACVLLLREQSDRNRASRGDAHATVEHEARARTAELEATLQELAVSEARLRGIFDSATDAVLTADEGQTIVMANDAAAATFRTAPGALVGKPLQDLVPLPFRARHHRDVQAFADDRSSARHMGRSREVTALRTDGEVFPIDASISHVSIGGQRLYTVILRDITERRQAERDLLAAKLKLEVALASMTDAVFIADADGHLVDFNDAFVSFHRWRDKAECPRTLSEHEGILAVFLPSGEPAPMADQAVARALRGETGRDVEFGLQRKDSGERWVGSYSFAPMRSREGVLLGAVVTARDITAMKLAETDLRNSHAELQRLIARQDTVQDDERRRIARELHDDLQQSLAAIRMDSAAIEGLLPDAPADVANLVHRIDQLAAAALASTRRIVSDLRPELLEELGLVSALEILARQFTERTRVPCALTATDGADALLESVPRASGCLFRVAQEALNNVAKHARARNVQMSLGWDGGAGVTLTVADDGCGMAADAPRQPLSFGLLGSRERLRALGGSFQIDSSPGRGTAVIARLDIPAAGDRTRH